MVRSLFPPTAIFSAAVFVMFLASCGNNAQHDSSQSSGAIGKILDKKIAEAFVSAPSQAQAVASPAVWHGGENRHWVVAASQQDNKLVVYDGITGKLLQSVGSAGTGPGQFREPTGVSIAGDLAVVVEKGNRRAQVFLLPDFRPLGFFGEKQLSAPGSITMYRLFEDRYFLFVSDNPGGKATQIHKYEMNYSEGDFRSAHIGAFGDSEGPGAIKQSGVILVDALNNRLLVADVDASQNNIKVYSGEGTFTGTVISGELFENRPDGIALFEGQGATGYWIVTDRHESANTFHVLNRQTFEPAASFNGNATSGCTGVCVTDVAFGNFKKGAFYAVNSEGKVSAYSWETLITGLNLDDVSQAIAMR